MLIPKTEDRSDPGKFRNIAITNKSELNWILIAAWIVENRLLPLGNIQHKWKVDDGSPV